MKKFLIIGNWKMNPENFAKAFKLAKETQKVSSKLKKTTIVCSVPHVYLQSLVKLKKKEFFIGAQDVFFENSGAFTGMVSPLMLKNFGIGYCIVGHSEKRNLGDSNNMVSRKIVSLLSNNITPILCVGEQKRDSDGWHLSFIRDQIESVFKMVPKNKIQNVIIAYEPVWAIGKNALREASPEECNEMVLFIRKIISDIAGQNIANKIRFIYGGSVDESNAIDFILNGGVTGLLPGRASLDSKVFSKILNSVDSI